MIDVQVGTEDVIDLVRAHPGGPQIIHPSGLAPVLPAGHAVVGLVVADAGVDDNGVAAGAHQVGLHGDDDDAVRSECLGLEPVAVGLDVLRCGVGEDLQQGQKGVLGLDDTVDLDVAQAIGIHFTYRDRRADAFR